MIIVNFIYSDCAVDIIFVVVVVVCFLHCKSSMKKIMIPMISLLFLETRTYFKHNSDFKSGFHVT